MVREFPKTLAVDFTEDGDLMARAVDECEVGYVYAVYKFVNQVEVTSVLKEITKDRKDIGE